MTEVIADFDEFHIDTAGCSQSNNSSHSCFKDLFIHGVRLLCKLDSGAEANVMPYSTYKTCLLYTSPSPRD